MSGLAYYNEVDPYCVRWLRNLIDWGMIAPGEVDDRSIEDVTPADLRGFAQCHFFAGIGVWSYALRQAGWPDDRQVWTGSCPCQPFSAAGKGGGFADERHLWPAWHMLIEQCRPATVFGEQVASKDGLAWLDLVHADLEAARYAVGAFDLCAAGVGAPHIRQRLYFVGHADDDDGGGRHGRGLLSAQGGTERSVRGLADSAQLAGAVSALADDDETGLGVERRTELLDGERQTLGHDADGRGELGDVADTASLRRLGRARAEESVGDASPERCQNLENARQRNVTSFWSVDELEHTTSDGRQQRRPEPSERGVVGRRGESFWSAADWLPCTDGKARPVEPGTFPLAHGAPARVGRLRAYGNAIVAPLAAEFVRAYLDAER